MLAGTNKHPPCLFTGDHLFVGGCGKLHPSNSAFWAYVRFHQLLFSFTLCTCVCAHTRTGQIFEGTSAVMAQSLNRLLEADRTSLVFPGHDYALPNLQFTAHRADPDNRNVKDKLEAVMKLASAKELAVSVCLCAAQEGAPSCHCEVYPFLCTQTLHMYMHTCIQTLLHTHTHTHTHTHHTQTHTHTPHTYTHVQVPAVLSEELSYNPFLRLRDPNIQAATGLGERPSDEEVLLELRRMKNKFSGFPVWF